MAVIFRSKLTTHFIYYHNEAEWESLKHILQYLFTLPCNIICGIIKVLVLIGIGRRPNHQIMWEPTHTLLINGGGVGRLTKHKTPDSHRVKSEDSGVEGEG